MKFPGIMQGHKVEAALANGLDWNKWNKRKFSFVPFVPMRTFGWKCGLSERTNAVTTVISLVITASGVSSCDVRLRSSECRQRTRRLLHFE
jgi:hypothetical protein